jgi:hypothetical protein
MRRGRDGEARRCRPTGPCWACLGVTGLLVTLKQKTPAQGTSEGHMPVICEALAGRYDMSSCDLRWVRKQWLEIRVHELPGPFRRFLLPGFILKDRG